MAKNDPFDFILSDESINDCGFWVPTDGIDVTLFQRNPVMLYGHQWDKVIGRWDNIRKQEGKLIATAVFDETDEEALKVKSKVEQRMLNAVSIGFDIIETSQDSMWLKPGQAYPTPIKTQIYEASILPFGSNKNAMRLRKEGQMITLSQDSNKDLLNIILKKIPTKKAMENLFKKLGLSKDATEEQAIAALEKFQNDRVNSLVELGKAKGVINATNEEQYRKLAIADFENTNQLIQKAELAKPQEQAPVKPTETPAKDTSLVDAIRELAAKGNQQHDGNDRSKWGFAEWQAKDPKGLAELRKNDFAKYTELAKAYTGKTK